MPSDRRRSRRRQRRDPLLPRPGFTISSCMAGARSDRLLTRSLTAIRAPVGSVLTNQPESTFSVAGNERYDQGRGGRTSGTTQARPMRREPADTEPALDAWKPFKQARSWQPRRHRERTSRSKGAKRRRSFPTKRRRPSLLSGLQPRACAHGHRGFFGAPWHGFGMVGCGGGAGCPTGFLSSAASSPAAPTYS